MLSGQIRNINSTKYLVTTKNGDYDCTLRGIFRNQKITPLVGDYVEINENTRQVVKVLERKNFLTRPNIANVDVALIITSVKKPDLDLILLDKMIVHITANKITPVICFTKVDLLDERETKEFERVRSYYENWGYQTVINNDLENIKEILKNKVTLLCGQTGAGKSSLLNKMDPNLNLKTNPISDALNRGVHTTRYVSLYALDDLLVADTPGFSSLELTGLSLEDIQKGFKEFAFYDCAYRDCSHINTDGCEVQNKVGDKILESRYQNYQKFIKEYHENSSKFFIKR